MARYTANIITIFRMVCSVWLLLLPVFSLPFYVAYVLCGLSDMVDGTIARMTRSESVFGARLDTAADFIFAAAALLKLLPAIEMPGWLWLWAGVIGAIKISTLIKGLMTKKQLPALHTPANKIAGLMLFLWPLSLRAVDVAYSAVPLCIVVTFAALQERYYLETGRNIKL